MALTHDALHTELTTDPAGLGYAPFVASDSDNDLVSLLNKPTTTLILRNDFSSKEIVNHIVPADFAALTQLQLSKLNALFMQNATIDATDANMQQIFMGIFQGMPNTINALNAAAQRYGTRAEIVFGAGTTVTVADVALALRGAIG